MTHHPGRVPGGTPGGPRDGAPVPAALRPLLRLTLVSLAVTVLTGVVEAWAGPGPVPGPLPGAGIAGPTTPLGLAVLAYGLLLTAALYALVYLPLRERRQWGWVLGIVLCALAVLGDAVDLLVHLLSGRLLPGLLTLGLVGVNTAWLVVAGRPAVRAVLR
ncbi:hypothetical protein MRU69_05020 [Kocuria flava]|uniref:hypothetical protein n=1 Tax=Kocuria flava TaxID=446860 RepID=UPI001FF55D67|nr:hypothetical protein [Kocuria flava]MCJ8504226.1 hypothetical protein [Kocuria flava]